MIPRYEVEHRSRHVFQRDGLHFRCAVATRIRHRPCTGDDVVGHAVQWVQSFDIRRSSVHNLHGASCSFIQHKNNFVLERGHGPFGRCCINEQRSHVQVGTNNSCTRDIAQAHLDEVIAFSIDDIGNGQGNIVAGDVDLDGTSEVQWVGHFVSHSQFHAGTNGDPCGLQYTWEGRKVIQAHFHADVCRQALQGERTVSHHVRIADSRGGIATIGCVGHIACIGRSRIH